MESILTEEMEELSRLYRSGMVQDECTGLVAVIQEYLGGRKGPYDVAKKIAGVEIVLDRAREIIGPENVDFWKNQRFANMVAPKEV